MGSPNTPKAPPPPSPPPTETSTDVAQAESTQKKRMIGRGGRMDTILNRQVNPAESGGNSLLGQ